MSSPGSHAAVPDAVLAADLAAALAEGEVRPHYQPLVELPGALVTGVEALARWTHPVLGPVPPDRFVAVAERSALIGALGRSVLRQACGAAAAWVPAVGPAPTVAVNVSPRQLVGHELVRDVAAALEETGLAPARLCLEVTETAAIEDLGHTRELLEQLRGLGVRVALDDFGTGYSSLTVLHALPVDLLKLDRAFVDRVAVDSRNALLVRLLVDAAHALGLAVCAEGVETDAQARQLVALGCDEAQGWLFGRPAPGLPELPHTLTGRAASPWRFDADLPPPQPVRGGDDLVVRTSSEGEVLYVSTSVRALLGRNPADLVGRQSDDFLHLEDRPRRDGRPFRVRVRHRNGSWRWLEARGEPLPAPDGLLREVLWTGRDITDRVEVEQALSESEALYRRTFDGAPTGVALSSLDGQILRVNAALAALLGRSTDELLRLTVEEVTHPEDRAADAGNTAALAAGVEEEQVVDKRYVDAAGRGVPVRVFVRVLPDLKGEPAYVVAHVLPRGDGA